MLFLLTGACALVSAPVAHAQDEPPEGEIEPPPEACNPTGELECDDENQCTVDACVNGYCVNTPLLDGSICDDLDPCTDGDMCIDGECVAIPRDCDDDNVCTSDRCDWVPEQPWFVVACFHDPVPGDCDDEDACTENDTCSNGSCTGRQVDCDDGNDCTVDTCDPASGCVYTPVADGTTCDDEDSCTVNDICLYGACIGGRFRVCDDGNPCTNDDCVGQGCQYTNNTASCDDGDACTDNDTCSNGACSGTPMDCSDSDPCTMNERCEFGVGCMTDPTCDDDDVCTTDNCDANDGTCSYDPIWPPPPQWAACSTHDCNVSMGTPALILSNDDDDNGNQIPDYLDVGPVAGENDLVAVPLAWPGCPLSQCAGQQVGWELGARYENRPFLAYRGSDMTGLIAGPQMYDGVSEPWPPVSTAYLSGYERSFMCGDPLRFRTMCTDHHCWEDSAPIVVVRVGAVRWSEAAAGNPPIDWCPSNGGRRIFPGKIDPNDQLQQIRRKVKLVARVAPPIAGVTVYFKVWDVDDPFDQLHGPNRPPGATEVPDVHLIDNDLTGPDNRPTPETAQTVSAITDANGEAIVILTVSMQPGNNYRAAASCLQDAVNQATQATADALSTQYDPQSQTYSRYGSFSGYGVPAAWSPMLTVWRKLHVETDTMSRPTFAQNTISTYWNEPRFPSGTLRLDIDDQHDDDFFENGFIRIQAQGFPDLVARIITFEHSFADDEILTNITPQQWGGRPTSGSHPCIISDDDLADEANFTSGVVGSDIGLGLPPQGILLPPNTSELRGHYELSYILPLVAHEHTSTTGISFRRNINDLESPSAWTPLLPMRGLPVSSPGFWTTYIYSAFQPEQDQDVDVEPAGTKGINTHKESLFGDTKTFSHFGPQYTGMSAIFVETLRDGYPEAQQGITIAHEIAHTLGVDHGDGLMHKETQSGSFSAQSLLELRSYQGP